MDRVDIVTGTLGKALGGAMGGFTSAKKEVIEILRQRSRPYLFSNSLTPSIVGASIAVFDMLSETTELRDKLEYNINYFKQGLVRFYKYNSHFGKINADLVYKMDENNITKIICVKSFNDKHIPFNNIDRQNTDFLTDHLDYENIVINPT
jgi:7-keto-8-aminopelargonate synthetase-like enzyme